MSLVRLHSRVAPRTCILAAQSLIVALCAVSVAAPPGDAGRAVIRDLRADVAGGHSSSQVLVQITPALAESLKKSGPKYKAGSAVASDAPALSRTLKRTMTDWNVSRLSPVFVEGFAHPELARKYGLDRYYLMEVPTGSDTPALAAAVALSFDDVEKADPVAVGEVADVIPTDPEFNRQYALFNNGIPMTGTSTDSCPDSTVWCADSDIRAPEAWELTTGSPDVIIAVIDSGVYPHLEFSGRMLPGKNTVDNSTNTSDGCPHGTHVAGIIGAGANNNIFLCPNVENPDAVCGTVGVNWNSKILPVKVLTGCSGGVNAVAAGIIWAADQGADVMNISLQFYLEGSNNALSRILIDNALKYATDAGALVISAAGNGLVGGAGVTAYPGKAEGSMCVSATNACDEFCTNVTSGWNSNWGPEVDISAPGDDIYSTWTSNTFRCLFGTSMATPHVVGVASLVKSYAPELTPCSIRGILTSSAVDRGPIGRDVQYGFGRVDAYGALIVAADWPQMLQTDPPSGAIDARRPHVPGNPFAQQGWQFVRAGFRGDTGLVSAGDFTVNTLVSSLAIAGVAINNNDVTIELDQPIPQGSWTVISHPSTCTKTVLGFQPGDVNGDGTTDLSDLEALQNQLAAMNDSTPGVAGESALLPAWSTDINRSGETTPADLLELIDLMVGAGTYAPYLNTSLPPRPE